MTALMPRIGYARVSSSTQDVVLPTKEYCQYTDGPAVVVDIEPVDRPTDDQMPQADLRDSKRVIGNPRPRDFLGEICALCGAVALSVSRYKHGIPAWAARSNYEIVHGPHTWDPHMHVQSGLDQGLWVFKMEKRSG